MAGHLRLVDRGLLLALKFASCFSIFSILILSSCTESRLAFGLQDMLRKRR